MLLALRAALRCLGSPPPLKSNSDATAASAANDGFVIDDLALSTQDAMLLLKRAIFDNTTRDAMGILALDLSKAFDRLLHRHILTEISALNPILSSGSQGTPPTRHGFRALPPLIQHRHAQAVDSPRCKPKPEAGIQPRHEQATKVSLSRENRTRIMVDLVPRNIHPVHHEGRRFARAKAILQKINQQKLEALFFDAARYHGGDKFAISVVDAGGNMVNAASVYAKTAHVAEEAVIVLALHSTKAPAVVYSDSRTAVRSFSSAPVSQQANKIVTKALQRTRKSSEGGITSRGTQPTSMARLTRSDVILTSRLIG
ncbi:hypothetical protein HPB50_017935 [Hyalomma asiaticum]|uniref:Uncharacterized protein n=1 Tax=Hyalomma asiaticum TaxID=266040 RepID=A0ACB7T5J9_HYAAI|nr:hypothetical protein HPB50_017935 [Hyalomma asiaticum]